MEIQQNLQYVSYCETVVKFFYMASIRGFYGTLFGMSCEMQRLLPEVTVRIYKAPRGEKDQESTQAAIASPPKETFRILEEKEADSKKNRLLAEIKTDEQGGYQTEVDNKQKDY